MQTWIIFGLISAFTLGIANLPQKIALGTISPFAYGILVGGVTILVNLLLLWWSGDSLELGAKKEWGYGLLAAIVFAIGAICISLGYRSGANPAVFPALFNMNTLVAAIAGVVLMREGLNVPVWQAVVGSLFVVMGAVLVTMEIKV